MDFPADPTRPTIRLVVLMVGLMAVLPVARGSYPVTVGFEGPQASYESYSENGFYFTSTYFGAPRFWIRYNFDLPAFAQLPFPINGVKYPSFDSAQWDIRFTNMLGRTFAMRRVDLAEYSTFVRNPLEVTFTGHRHDGSTVVQSFTIDGAIDGIGPLQDFQRFDFGPEFTNVYWVTVAPNIFALDNLVMEVNGMNLPPAATLVKPASGSSFALGQRIEFESTASDLDGNVVAVEYVVLAGETNVLGRADTPPFRLAISTLAEGTYLVGARALDNLGASQITGTRLIWVTNRVTTTTRDQDQPAAGGILRLTSTGQVAQTFIPQITGTLRGVRLVVGADLGSPVYPITVDVLDVIEGMPGSNVLGTATLPAAAITPGVVQPYNLTFSNGPFLKERFAYALRISSPATAPGMRLDTAPGDPYGGGRLWQRQDGGGWVALGDADLTFTSYMWPETPPLRIHQPPHQSRFGAGADIAIEAWSSGSLSNIDAVEFYVDAQFLAAVTNVPTPGWTKFGVTWSNATVGTHLLEARAVSGSNLVELSSPVSLTVVEPNQAPSFSPGPDIVLFEDAGGVLGNHFAQWARDIVPGPAGESGQKPSFILTNDNPALFTAQPAMNATGSLAFALVANAHGTANVTAILQDDGGVEFGGTDTSAPGTFRITVLPVNDSPVFAAPLQATVLEDSGVTILPHWMTNISAGPSDESGQLLSVLLTNDNPGIFSMPPALSVDGTLTFATRPDAVGMARLTAWLRDDGGVDRGGVDTSLPHSFTITILGVNDPPSYQVGTNVVVLEDSGLQQMTNWVRDIRFGPPDEVQAMMFVTAVDRPELFSLAPAITPEGTLSFAFAPNSNGTAVLTVYGFDNGFWGNGGWHVGPTQSVTISAMAVYDPPVLTLVQPPAGSIVLEGTDLTLSATALYIESTLTNVEFLANDVRIGSDATAPYTLIWTNLVPGLYQLAARGTDHLGQTANSTPVPIRVNGRPTVGILEPTNAAVYPPAPTVVVTALGMDADGSIERIDLFDVATFIGGGASNPVTVVWNNVAPGIHRLTARATDDLGASRTSSVVTITVARPPQFHSPGAQVLIEDSSFWRYFDVGTNPPPDWRRLDFDDGAWPVGAAELGTGGDGREVSIIGRARPVTAYFRQAFQVTNRTSLADLTVSVLRDDGVVVYLNETEVFRSNMPTGAVDYSTRALVSIAPPNESTYHSTNVALMLLTNGWNVLAAELHQAPSSLDLSFDLRLVGQFHRVSTDSVTMLTNGTVALEFLSLSNRHYTIQYSSNLVHWRNSAPPVVGDGQRVRWIDSGPPVTETPPGAEATRLYRIRLEP